MDKQVEEMANDLQEAWTAWSLSTDLKNPYAFVAEILVKKWQPKIPEGAVVLTPAERDEEMRLIREAVIERMEATRKETAEKFAERVKMAFYYEFDELIPSIMADKIDEICKGLVDE